MLSVTQIKGSFRAYWTQEDQAACRKASQMLCKDMQAAGLLRHFCQTSCLLEPGAVTAGFVIDASAR